MLQLEVLVGELSTIHRHSTPTISSGEVATLHESTSIRGQRGDLYNEISRLAHELWDDTVEL